MVSISVPLSLSCRLGCRVFPSTPLVLLSSCEGTAAGENSSSPCFLHRIAKARLAVVSHSLFTVCDTTLANPLPQQELESETPTNLQQQKCAAPLRGCVRRSLSRASCSSSLRPLLVRPCRSLLLLLPASKTFLRGTTITTIVIIILYKTLLRLCETAGGRVVSSTRRVRARASVPATRSRRAL